MIIKPNEISELIKEQIKSYSHKLETTDVGSVVSVGDGVATVYGLDNCMLNELLEFPNGIYGMALNLNESSVGVVMLGEDRLIREGDIVKRTGKVVEVTNTLVSVAFKHPHGIKKLMKNHKKLSKV